MNRTPDWPGAEAPHVLLIGGGGMLGRAWQNLLSTRGLTFDAPPRSSLDLLDEHSIHQALTSDHRLVVNCAAWTDVDAAESQEQEATALNGTAVAHLAERCRQTGSTLIHYSTDYVFSGDASAPYRTSAPRAPLGAYGRSKLAGELALEASSASYLLIRTSWLYAPWGRNFVRSIAGAARSRPELRIVSDQRGRPTSSEHLAAASLKLYELGARGTFHITDGGECTWYDFGRQIVALTASSGCSVQPCTTQEFPRPARRPAYSVMDLTVTEALLGPMPPWTANLADVVRQLEPLP